MFLKEVRPGNLVFLGHICPVVHVGVSEDRREDLRRPLPPQGLATCRPRGPEGPEVTEALLAPALPRALNHVQAGLHLFCRSPHAVIAAT